MMHDDIPALLPCPFCGNSAVRFNQRPLGISWVVECINCRARGPEIHVQHEAGKDRAELSGKAKKKAADGWNNNRRTGDAILAWMNQCRCVQCGKMFPKEDMLRSVEGLLCFDCYQEMMEVEEMLK